jgi:hypothetical protein
VAVSFIGGGNPEDTTELSKVKSKSNQKVLFKVGTFYNNQHKLSRAFQTDMKSQLDRTGIKIQLYKLHAIDKTNYT